MEKNKVLQPLSRKKDFDLLKKKALVFSHEWLKILFLYEEEESLKLAWSLPKKYIPGAVTRNRLKRWGRENMRTCSLKGMVLVVFFQKEKNFYETLKREDLNRVFCCVLDKVRTKT